MSTSISSLQERVTNAAKVMKITEEELWFYLKELGIEQEDQDAVAMLEANTTREGDARSIFCEEPKDMNNGEKPEPRFATKVKLARFLAGWAILKGKSNTENAEKSDIVSIVEALKPVTELRDEELLQKYNKECSTQIIDELKKRSQDRAFVIFKEDEETTDVVNSIKLLRVARRQETPSTFMADGRPVRPYRIGDFPMTFLYECPIHPDVILIEDYCDKCKQSWAGISHEDRVIIRVAHDCKAIDVSCAADIHELIIRVKAGGTKHILEIPMVNMYYKELTDENRLPMLRRKVSSSITGKKDPLFVHKSY